MKMIIKSNRQGYGEVWFGGMKLVSSDFMNVGLVKELLEKLGYTVSFEEI